MSTPLKIKTTILSIALASASFTAPLVYAENNTVVDSGSANLVAGFGSNAIRNKLMNMAPVGNETTVTTNLAQASYLLSPNLPLVGPLTQQLLGQLLNVGKDKANDALSFTWNPGSKSNPKLDAEPIKSVDINTLLQPMTYNDLEATQAKNVINALSAALTPLNTVNFTQLIANLSGDKAKNLLAKLNEKQIQEYLAALRGYVATQTVALSNLYQLYAERQAIDPKSLTAEQQKALNGIKGPVSTLKLENLMTTRRIVDEKWYKNLIQDNPATLQREQTQLLAEILAESHRARMTSERLLATMSVLVLEINQQIRTQLQNQIQTINNPPKTGQ